MKKTCVFLAGILLVILLVYACEMPHSVVLQTEKFKINAPVKTARFNIATALSEALKDAFPEGFEIYDMVNYRGAQAFLIGYLMDNMLESFNPDDYLDDIKTQVRSLDDLAPEEIEPIYPESIDIPKMTTDAIPISWFCFDMTGFFQNMQNQINDDPASTPPSPSPSLSTLAHNGNDTQTVSLMPTVDFLPFMVFRSNPPPEDYNFEAVYMEAGGVELSIKLEFVNHSDPDLEDLEITLTGIELKGSVTGNHIGEPGTKTATLTYDIDPDKSFTDTITVNFVPGEAIEKSDPPQFVLGGITSTCGTLSSSPKTFPFTVVMHPQLKNIALRGAEALKIGRTEQEIPSDIIQNIRKPPVDDMINAQILEGNFRIEANPPHSEPNIPPPGNTTYCKGMDIGYKIVLRQAPADPVYGVSSVECLDGVEFTDTNDSMAGKWISGKEMTVNNDPDPNPGHDYMSYIIIQADPSTGATFELFDVNDQPFVDEHGIVLPLTHKKLPIKMDMGMDIDKLKVVRWKTINALGDSILPKIELPPINFATLGEGDPTVSFLKTITFKDIIMDVNFNIPDNPPPPPSLKHGVLQPGGSGLPTALKNHIALKINCTQLGIDGPENTKILKKEDENQFISEGNELDIEHNKEIKFTVDLIPVIGGTAETTGTIEPNSPYIEFGPVEMKDENDVYLSKIKMQIYADVNIEFNWEKAEIDVQAAYAKLDYDHDPLKGTFPDLADDPVNLAEYLGKYMNGITFGDGIKAKLFLSGPHQLIEIIKPVLDFDVEWENDKVEHMLTQEPFKVADVPFKLPGKNSRGEWVYTGRDLPESGILMDSGFGKIVASLPEELRFSYAMVLPDADKPVTVYPYMFDDVEEGEDSSLKGVLVILLPLELVAEPGGYFSIPADLFGEEEADLFGRENAGDSSFFTGVKINSLGIKIDLGRSFLSGSHLHFDRDDILFGKNGLFLGDGNSLNIILSDVQKRRIEENLIYPDIKFVFPRARKLRIARDFLPVRIVIAASGSYTLDLDKYLGSD